MQTKRNLLALAIIITLAASSTRASGPDIIISSIALTNNPDGGFIELYNLDSIEKDISSYRLRTRNSNGKEDSLRVLPKGSKIPGHGYFLWAHSDSSYVDIADTVSGASLGDKYSLALFLPKTFDDVPIDSADWGSPSPFEGSARLPKDPPESNSFIQDISTLEWSVASILTPTNSKGERYIQREHCSVRAEGDTILISEFLPNPEKEIKEFIELYNPGDTSAALNGWKLKDKGSTLLLKDTSIAPHEYLIPEGSDSLSLNDSGGNTITLKDASGKTVDEACYTAAKDGVSLNRTASSWRGGTPTPGAANILNSLPVTKEKVPKKGYKGIPVAMTAKGKDADKDRLKYTWDFGDGHKSYKEETSHTYEKNGTYAVTLTVTDGSDDVIETFSIKIASYEPPDVRIVSFIPNPDGTDTDSEWILIENREKKKSADLKGFGIATGWKKLANHPIRESFVIPPKSSAKLTREYSLFTLPNEKGKIELRAPSGEVLQVIKYKLEKSAPEDAVYTKKKGERWKLGPAPKKPLPKPATALVPETETIEPERILTEGKPPVPTEETLPLPDEEKEMPKPEAPSVIIHDDTMTKDPDQPELSDLLSYGLSLHLPKAIAYVPSEQVPVTPAAAVSETKGISADDFFTQINAQINAWLNGI